MKTLLATSLVLTSGMAMAQTPGGPALQLNFNDMQDGAVRHVMLPVPVVGAVIAEAPGMNIVKTYALFAVAVYSNPCDVPQPNDYVVSVGAPVKVDSGAPVIPHLLSSRQRGKVCVAQDKPTPVRIFVKKFAHPSGPLPRLAVNNYLAGLLEQR